MSAPGITLRRIARAAFGATGLLLAGALGAAVTAQEAGEDDAVPPAPPGTPAAELVAEAARRDGPGDAERIITDSTVYDPAILTKFIAGTGFSIRHGAGIYNDEANYDNSGCVTAETTAPNFDVVLEATVSLPDGARIKRIAFFGINNAGVGNTIGVALVRSRFAIPQGGGDIVRTSAFVDSFSVPDDPSDFETVVYGANNLNERAGSLVTGGVTEHNFHSVVVQMLNSQGFNHRLCGIEVQYQVPTRSDVGTVFHPLAGYRAYDSRFEMAPVADGPLAKGANRVVPVKDGRNVGTGVVNQPNAIPGKATAVAYTLTVASPTSSGFLWVAPGNVTTLNGSSINWDTNTTGAIANSGIAKLDSQRRVRVFADGSPGASTHFIIDITGYYAPADLPNMAN